MPTGSAPAPAFDVPAKLVDIGGFIIGRMFGTAELGVQNSNMEGNKLGESDTIFREQAEIRGCV